MKCQEVESVAGDLARGKLLETEVRRLAELHIADCAGCAGRLAEERALALGLRALGGAARDRGASPAVEAALLSEFRKQRPAAARRSGAVRVAAILAVAAALVLAFLVRVEQPRPAAPVQVVQVQQQAPLVEPKPPEPQPVVAKTRPAVRRKRAVTPPRAVEVVREAPVMTEFLTVAQGDGWTPLDGGRLVRVGLPQSAMGAFGLPVNLERPAGRVQADVMLSEDGLVRAIRFVK